MNTRVSFMWPKEFFFLSFKFLAVWPRWVKAKDLGFELQMAPDSEALSFGLTGPLTEPIVISNLIYKVRVHSVKLDVELKCRLSN